MTPSSYTVTLRKDAHHRSFGIYIGEDVPYGVYIVTIEPNSPASNAHIQPGDRILAVNGQSVSTMPKNARDIITQIAGQAGSLTLMLQSSDILQSVDFPSTNNNDYLINSAYRYAPQQTNGLEPDLENYIKSLFGDENLQIVPAQSSNHNEYILTSTSYISRPRRSPRKRHHVRAIDTQTSMMADQKDHNVPLSPQRAVPSMGTPHFILRNTQVNSKDNTIDQYPQSTPLSPPASQPAFNQNLNMNGPTNPPSQLPVFSPQQSNSYPPQMPMNSTGPTNNVQAPLMNSNLPPINENGCREVFLRRLPNFSGYGFHLQYNKVYYIVHEIEHNSPAEKGGLRVNDIIRRINNQTTDHLEHKMFVQIVNSSSDINLIVQPLDEYIRTHPEAARVQNQPPQQMPQNKPPPQMALNNAPQMVPNNIPPMTPNMNNNNMQKEPLKQQSSLSKALAKFSNRYNYKS